MAVVVVAANGTDQAAAAAASGNARPPVDVDHQLFMAARCGNSELLLNKNDEEAGSVSLLPRVTMEGDTVLHVVAASGDGEEFLHCAKMIVQDYRHKHGGAAGAMRRLAREARNNKDDTPLHCAAGAGNANMISCLMDLIANNGDDDEAAAAMKAALVRMQNECGETALHQAVRAPHNNEACIDNLMEHDPELACVIDDDGTSPLYLAISLGEVQIARYLHSRSDGKLSYSGPNGRNILHAAVPRGQALPQILKWLIKDVKPASPTGCTMLRLILGWFIKDVKPREVAADSGSSVPLAAANCLLRQLISQGDKKGSTPLHLAASLEGWPDAGFFSSRFPRIRLALAALLRLPKSAAEQLLDAKESMAAYQADDKGRYPIHVAAWSGSLGVVKLLLERCPDCATRRDGKGRTFLHVAVKKKHHAVVHYAVRGGMPQHLSQMILNAQDSKGNTALHHAVHAGNLAVFNSLFRNRQVRLDVANKEGMTPLDLSHTRIEQEGFNYRLNPRRIVRQSLLDAGAQHGGGPQKLFTEKQRPKKDVDNKEKESNGGGTPMPLTEEQKRKKEENENELKKYTEAAQMMSIVTALIATITFASAFTLPGGYRPDGEPLLAGSYAFDAFILADTLAFICSLSSTCTLVYAGLPTMDVAIRKWYFRLSALLLQSAARSLVAAFGLGLYLILPPAHHPSAIAAYAIVFASSLYGNMAARQTILMAGMVIARIGIRPCAALRYAGSILFEVLVHFWSYVIIFGLPAIGKWVQQPKATLK